MIATFDPTTSIASLFASDTITRTLIEANKVLIKINLARAPEPNHPRTDGDLLRKVVVFLKAQGKDVAIAEAADGHIEENARAYGMADLLTCEGVSWIDIDTTPYSIEQIAGQAILIPNFFAEYDLRITLPCPSKRKGMLYSNNVKLFFGATPRIAYLRPDEGRWRSKLHDNLTQSVINVYDAFCAYAPFHLYINGGNAFSETTGAFILDQLYLSDSGIELDTLIYDRYFCHDEKPEYLTILQQRL